jgi:predicted lactoylglutathione lyase
MEHIILELDTSHSNPADRIKSREFIDGVLKAGSFISMIENKKINITTLFVLLLESKRYQDFFTEITSSDSFKEAILSLLFLHPPLVKSKFTKSIIRKANGKRTALRTRKTSL